MPRVLPAADAANRVDAVGAAVRALRNGRLVALPAEQGYVLTADAFSAAGVAALQSVKELPPTVSLGVLVGHVGAVHGLSPAVPHAALDLIAACWPGQLGLVLRTQQLLQWTVPTDRIVVRMPLHPLLLSVVAEVGPTVYSACRDQDREQADLVLDCGGRPDGSGSSIVDATVTPLTLLREGAFPLPVLREIVPDMQSPG